MGTGTGVLFPRADTRIRVSVWHNTGGETVRKGCGHTGGGGRVEGGTRAERPSGMTNGGRAEATSGGGG